jgi:RHH-type proline utilization regulon transcriptional repressor/proline dehydrogenase/delta 1-pyrroline-5-carboxylate dehydrogenase
VLVGRVAAAGATEARRAVDAAAAAFPQWRDTPASARAAALRRVAQILVRDRHELSALMVREVGKSWREADADLCEAADFCRYYAGGAERLARPKHVDLPGEENDWTHEPRGVAVVIAPWNFPLAILCGMTTAALATGNTVVMKPAEQSPVIAARLMDALEEAGIPAGVVNYLPGRGEEVGPALLEHPATALVAFIGSRDVGLALNRQGAASVAGRDHVVRVIAEMGGKNAIIVDNDADLDEAVAGVMHSAFGYQGQKCSACSRAIVLEGVHDQFLKRLVEAVRGWELLPAEDPGHGIGPVIDEEARARVLRAIERGRKEARLAYAGDAGGLADEGFYVAPHVFAEVGEKSFLAQEEVFGPVLAVLRARDLTHALAIANGTAYALTGGCYSRSPQALERVRREFRVGNLYLNRRITGALVGRQPFGGFKLSGIGSQAGGPEYLLQFTMPRSVTENTMRHGFAPERTATASETGI